MVDLSSGEIAKDPIIPQGEMTKETVVQKKDIHKKGWFSWLKRIGRKAEVPATIAEQFQDNVQDSQFGQPPEGATPFDASLINSVDENGNEVPPTFWSRPTDNAHQLTLEELKEKGIDPTSQDLKVIDIHGKIYASAGEPREQGIGFITDEKTGKNHGLWGEIVVGDKRTGIFVRGDHINQKENEEEIPNASSNQPQ